jgi:hypothetical protein
LVSPLQRWHLVDHSHGPRAFVDRGRRIAVHGLEGLGDGLSPSRRRCGSARRRDRVAHAAPGSVGLKREARLHARCPGCPRLLCAAMKTWMPRVKPGRDALLAAQRPRRRNWRGLRKITDLSTASRRQQTILTSLRNEDNATDETSACLNVKSACCSLLRYKVNRSPKKMRTRCRGCQKALSLILKARLPARGLWAMRQGPCRPARPDEPTAGKLDGS